MTLLRTYTFHTWHYRAHTHCTQDFTWVDNFPRKARFHANSCV